MFNTQYIVITNQAQFADNIFPELVIVAIANRPKQPGTFRQTIIFFCIQNAIDGCIVPINVRVLGMKVENGIALPSS